MNSIGPILIAYDGSDDARHAIEYAAAIRPGADVVVREVRQPFKGLAAHLEGPRRSRTSAASTRTCATRPRTPSSASPTSSTRT